MISSWSQCLFTILKILGPLRMMLNLLCLCSVNGMTKPAWRHICLQHELFKSTVEIYCSVKKKRFVSKYCSEIMYLVTQKLWWKFTVRLMLFSCLLTQHPFCSLWIKANLPSPIQLLKHWMCYVQSVIVMEENWALSVDQCQLQALQFSVHLIDLLSILLWCNGFTKIQQAVVDLMGSRPLVTMIFFSSANLALERALELLLGPTTELGVTGYRIKSTFRHTS